MSPNANPSSVVEQPGSLQQIEGPLIALSSVQKEYGPSVVALEEINFTVHAGEWIAVMGPSGSGKTTLLNLLGCLDSPSRGEIVIAGTDVSRLSKRQLTRFRSETVGFIFQQFYLIPYLTALENVMMAQYFHSMTDEREARRALERVGLATRLHHLPSQLSGGEQQRVAIARALINQPRILLADEPTGNLDAENEDIVMKLLQEIHDEGNTIVMVTHDPAIGRMAGRKIVLEHGRIVHSTTFSVEEETSFDEILEQIWVLEETNVPPTSESLHFNGGGRKVLPVMKQIGLLLSDRAVLEMTAQGRARASSIIRRHRLAERLFADTFDMHDDQELEANACTFEHILSPEVTERICAFLNHPAHCPHGSPIPPGPCCPRRA
ncbi:MAG: ATP-binding cassette domain-containing protein [Acidobacteria bacterium]|nr:ATP-binding cassette domain-containing protein [Acidobacteriota bacterium]